MTRITFFPGLPKVKYVQPPRKSIFGQLFYNGEEISQFKTDALNASRFGDDDDDDDDEGEDEHEVSATSSSPAAIAPQSTTRNPRERRQREPRGTNSPRRSPAVLNNSSSPRRAGRLVARTHGVVLKQALVPLLPMTSEGDDTKVLSDEKQSSTIHHE